MAKVITFGVPSVLHTAASLLIKIQYPNGEEAGLGIVDSFNFTQNQGQKLQFCVDSPMPYAVDQGAAPSSIHGTLSCYLPKGTHLEAMGLVPYRHTVNGTIYQGISKTFNIRLYDRDSLRMIYSLDNCKVSAYSIGFATKNFVKCSLTFEGTWTTPGLPLA